jgi:hypothetical protein
MAKKAHFSPIKLVCWRRKIQFIGSKKANHRFLLKTLAKEVGIAVGISAKADCLNALGENHS